MKQFVTWGLLLALIVSGLDVEAAFSPSLAPAAASINEPSSFFLTNLLIQEELGLTIRQYANMSKKEQKQAKKSVVNELESLLASAFGGTVTKKFAKTYFDALYGKPGNPADPDAFVPGL